MHTYQNNILLPTLCLIAVAFSAAAVNAQGDVPGCLPSSTIVYSPFQPVNQTFYTKFTGATDNGCWWWAGCVLAEADEPRKLQFASVSLVMGLIPLTLKDLAWPERRVVPVSKQLPPWADVVVRALGDVPKVGIPLGAAPLAKGIQRGGITKALSLSRAVHWIVSDQRTFNELRILLIISAVVLIGSYATMAVVELYSKRSALGCVYPVFIATWHLIALLPAFLTSKCGLDVGDTINLSATTQEIGEEEESQEKSTNLPLQQRLSKEASTVPAAVIPDSNSGASAIHSSVNPMADLHRKGHAAQLPESRKRPTTLGEPSADTHPFHNGTDLSPESSSVQGRGLPWLIQLIWAVYYIAGTLVYSSIMAVLVIELVVWVFVSILATAVSKVLAFSICVYYEKKIRQQEPVHS